MPNRDLTELEAALAAKEAFISDKVKSIAQLRQERKAHMDACRDTINELVEELDEAVAARDAIKDEIRDSSQE